MSLTRIQRAAMARAQRGDWELADAMELLAPGRRTFNGQSLLWGVYQGGRLQAFAYGIDGTDYDDSEDGDDDIDAANSEVRYVVTLNGDVVFDHEVHAFPAYGDDPDMTLAKAAKVVHDFTATAAKPSQQPLFTEPA